MKLIVRIERVLYRKDETPWCIFKAENCSGEAAKASLIVCKGAISFKIQEGDRLELDGAWVEYQGEQQFSFKSALPNLPVDLGALLHYACTTTKGLGQIREAQIWAKYQERWIDAETLEIDGLPEKTQFEWSNTLKRIKEQKEQTQAISYLLSHGCTVGMANAAWEQWKLNTLGNVQSDFYCLAELPRYGFSIIDSKVRPFFDMADDDPRRLKAAIRYSLERLTDNGNTVAAKDDLRKKTNETVPCTEEAYIAAVKALEDLSLIIQTDAGVCLASDWKNESAIFERFLA